MFFSIPIYCDECTPQDHNFSGHKGRKAHISMSDKHNSLLHLNINSTKRIITTKISIMCNQ